MDLPNLTRTIAEARQLAAEIFPGEETALARLPPDTHLQRYQLMHETANRLREVLIWLHERKPRIYKRARWRLFYDLALLAAQQLDENGQAKVRELYSEDSAKQRANSQAAQTMTGDGMGI